MPKQTEHTTVDVRTAWKHKIGQQDTQLETPGRVRHNWVVCVVIFWGDERWGKILKKGRCLANWKSEWRAFQAKAQKSKPLRPI